MTLSDFIGGTISGIIVSVVSSIFINFNTENDSRSVFSKIAGFGIAFLLGVFVFWLITLVLSNLGTKYFIFIILALIVFIVATHVLNMKVLKSLGVLGLVCIVFFKVIIVIWSSLGFDDPDSPIEMVYVEGGTFMMGCTAEQEDDCKGREKPAHSVTLSSFYIGKYEITQIQYKEIMGNNPSEFKNCDQCPVENVSWDDAVLFAKELSHKTGKTYRLPTEAEWEYAARGGVTAKSVDAPKYANSFVLNNVAWCGDNSEYKTHPVGQKTPNKLGIYDMSGNVYEWCSDRYDGGYYKSSPSSNPKGAKSGTFRVHRGGCWKYNAEYCRVADRGYFTPGDRCNDFGFRLLLVP
jgi:formylglycine-generating enzyme required for sulfatase activity